MFTFWVFTQLSYYLLYYIPLVLILILFDKTYHQYFWKFWKNSKILKKIGTFWKLQKNYEYFKHSRKNLKIRKNSGKFRKFHNFLKFYKNIENLIFFLKSLKNCMLWKMKKMFENLEKYWKFKKLHHQRVFPVSVSWAMGFPLYKSAIACLHEWYSPAVLYDLYLLITWLNLTNRIRDSTRGI